MRLEILNDKILIWSTTARENSVIYDSTNDLDGCDRRNLSQYADFLRDNGEIKESDRITEHLGKIIRALTIPELIPTGNYKVDSRFAYLQTTIKEYTDHYGLDLDPDFQRAHVWSMEQRIKFVEFILQGGKTNPIYFNHTAWMTGAEGDFVIVDGKQRLTSLLMFLDNAFAVLKNLDPDGIGFYAREFDFIPNNIALVVNNLPTRKQVLEWYLQINKGNVAHTESELQKVEDLLKSEK